MKYADGSTCEGRFDFSWNKQGQCIIRYPGGNWYYGYFTDNREDGEGSIHADGKSYDVTFNNGTMISAVEVSNPKYDLDELDALKAYYAQEAIRQMNEFEINTNSSTYSNSSSRNSSSSSSSQCNLCGGSGKCRTCSGKGNYIPRIGGNTIGCSVCNRTGNCHSCNGTGRR